MPESLKEFVEVGCRPRVTDGLIHLSSCLAMSAPCLYLGSLLLSRGDYTPARTFCAGASLYFSGIELLFIAIIGLAFLPKGRWRGWRQPLAIATWIALGALISGLLEITVNLKPIESLLLVAWITWLPAFWLFKWRVDRRLGSTQRP